MRSGERHEGGGVDNGEKRGKGGEDSKEEEKIGEWRGEEMRRVERRSGKGRKGTRGYERRKERNVP